MKENASSANPNLIIIPVKFNENGTAGFTIEASKNLLNTDSTGSSKIPAIVISSIQATNSKLEVGDELLHVNGRKVSEMSLADVQALLKGPPKQDLYLVIKKHEDKIDAKKSTLSSLGTSSNSLAASTTALNNVRSSPTTAERFITDLAFGDTTMDGVVEVIFLNYRIIELLFFFNI